MNPSDQVRCPRCHAENRASRAVCFLCENPLVHAQPIPSASPVKQSTQPSFRLGSLMLLIALIAVFLGLFREAPGLTIFLVVPSSFALWRTIAVARQPQDAPPSLLNHIGVFLGALGLIMLIMIASIVAFFFTCLGITSTGKGPYGGDMLGPGLFVGAVIGVAVFISLLVAISRARARQKHRKNPPFDDLDDPGIPS